ncbi:hypothetical protein DBZ36_04340 [Alginatibacterium sediminis]|uniref:DUF1570 domain-containing protein n=1 Tax=Alginatibacterium sediminis TaxID=2164068 RepID=A0A420EG95_9ALTE|nr:DUF4344 domain-containing metallopeptidase [Alginatibacterium sediminis]RKF19698.1 hypothetical protein DBZ36_04340 [Alginatibacterium sediminis]
MPIVKLSCYLFILLSSVSLASAQVSLRVLETNSDEQSQGLLPLYRQSISDLVMLLNQRFELSQSLEVVVGADDGPLFDPQSEQILIPFEFVTQISHRFEEADYLETGITVEQAVSDAILHTLLHEFGHALVYQYELPIVGKEEDVVDSLANFLLINFFQEGQEIVLSAADLFDLESQDVTEFSDQDFWDEHSLDAQRYFTSLCHVYGSASMKYQNLVDQAGFSEERKLLCEEEYLTLERSWSQLLAPLLNN